LIVMDAVKFKYLPAPLSKAQLEELIQIPSPARQLLPFVRADPRGPQRPLARHGETERRSRHLTIGCA
jgi:hypothetical protein